jgi:hypothetical protein
MKRSQLAWYGVGLAAVVGVLVVSSVPSSTALFITVLLACPLMMLVLGGHGGSGHGGKASTGQAHNHISAGHTAGPQSNDSGNQPQEPTIKDPNLDPHQSLR